MGPAAKAIAAAVANGELCHQILHAYFCSFTLRFWSIYIYIYTFCDVILYISFKFGFSPFVVRGSQAKVSEREACTLAAAFWDEVCNLPGANEIHSSTFLELATRLSKSKHECLLSSYLPKFGLSAGINLSYVDVGIKSPHPVLSIGDFISKLDQCGKMDLLLMGNGPVQFRSFWEKWRRIQPNHSIYKVDPSRLDWSIPVAIHTDEGTSQKKKALMIIQYQTLMGRGTSKRKSDESNPDLNFTGNSITTRLLYSCMMGRIYSLKKNKNRPLLQLMKHLGDELHKASTIGFRCKINGIERRLFLVCLGLKGDWPALSKIGTLTRHHGRDTYSKPDGPGICHLCLGGQLNQAWHDISYENMQKMRAVNDLPWEHDPILVTALHLEPEYQAEFFRVDLFHTCHKGMMADVAANIVVP